MSEVSKIHRCWSSYRRYRYFLCSSKSSEQMHAVDAQLPWRQLINRAVLLNPTSDGELGTTPFLLFSLLLHPDKVLNCCFCPCVWDQWKAHSVHFSPNCWNAGSVPSPLGFSRVHTSALPTLFLKPCSRNFLFRSRKEAKELLVLPLVAQCSRFFPRSSRQSGYFSDRHLSYFFTFSSVQMARCKSGFKP